MHECLIYLPWRMLNLLYNLLNICLGECLSFRLQFVSVAERRMAGELSDLHKLHELLVNDCVPSNSLVANCV